MLAFGPSVPALKEPEITFWGFVGKFFGSLWELAVVRSALGLLALFVAYSASYWLLLYFTRAYFIEIAPFRIWRDPSPGHLPQGLASRLVDELLRLQREVREHGLSPDSGRSRVQFHKVSWQTPVARQVTLEFKGVSPEAVNEFLRRLFRRHVLITSEVIPLWGRLRLIGRSARAGPWEVDAPEEHGTGQFRRALREFAVRAMVEVQPRASKALANALAFKQGEAYIKGDHEEALLLAKLASIALPEHAVQFYNLGHAYQSSDDMERAIGSYDEAVRRFEADIARASKRWRRLFTLVQNRFWI